MERFDHKALETKWRAHWYTSPIYRAEDHSPKKKRYILVEFPYPSGAGLHCGHVYRFTMPDVYVRMLRMKGENVLFPIGWDAFGLPAENYAIQTGIHPSETTRNAVNTYRNQLQMMGYSFDWSREIDTTDPGYYKWTQWIFLRMWERGLAEFRDEPVWWCEALKSVLANEEVLDDEEGNKISERGEHPVVRRNLKQWILKIPAYADQLLAGLETIDFTESIKTAQRNWIGRSEGAAIRFPLSAHAKHLEVFTTRPDTILGATFMVLAPEHPLVDELLSTLTNRAEVEAYRSLVSSRSDRERAAQKEKTGVQLKGVTATNPLAPSLPQIPLFIADYVLLDYGTGAIMAVPAHDERDFEFAKKFGIPVVQTVAKAGEINGELPLVSEDGVILETPELMDLGKANGVATRELSCAQMKSFVIETLEKKSLGTRRVTYKLRDWIFSRQRYWGEPIPLVHCEDGTIEGIARSDSPDEVNRALPLILPPVPDYRPTSDGAAPLSRNTEWVTTTSPSGKGAVREVNTMPGWAGSSWYYLRYIDPKNEKALADRKKMEYWLPVDKYFGGNEHTTLHLLYSRFWHQFLYNEKIVPTPEPYKWRMSGGILLGEDGQKMSKSRGNVLVPDHKVSELGADALRMYICFMGPYDATLPWSESGLKACRKVLDRIYTLSSRVTRDNEESAPEPFRRAYHKFVKRVGSMLENLKANTAVSEIMIFLREAEAQEKIPAPIWEGFLKVLAPFAVFLSEDLWCSHHGFTDWDPSKSIHLQPWPSFDEALARDEIITVGVQVNGKLREQVEIGLHEDQEAVKARVLGLEKLEKWIGGKELVKFIYVPGRIVNIVVK